MGRSGCRGLYEDIQAGKVELVSRDPSIDPGWKDQVVRQAVLHYLGSFSTESVGLSQSRTAAFRCRNSITAFRQ